MIFIASLESFIGSIWFGVACGLAGFILGKIPLRKLRDWFMTRK